MSESPAPGLGGLMQPAPEDVEVRRSPRATRVSVRVDRATGNVRVTLPARAPASEVSRALHRHRRWLDARLREAQVVQAELRGRAGRIAVWGEPLELLREPGRRRVRRDGSRLIVPADDDRLAERWLRERAREELAPRTHAAAAALDRAVRRVAIGDARSRWGSCSAKATISYSWRLVLAPPWVAEAIVWHEACHLVELNHSARFWTLLRSHEPRTDEARAWLRAHGPGLQLPPP